MECQHTKKKGMQYGQKGHRFTDQMIKSRHGPSPRLYFERPGSKLPFSPSTESLHKNGRFISNLNLKKEKLMKGDGTLQYSVKKGLHHLAHRMLGTTPRKKCFRTLKEPADEKHSSLERYLLLVFFVVFRFFRLH